MTCRPVRFLSLFSGIEAASLAWLPLGWECVGVAEVDKFCCSLLAQRFPAVPNLGDVTAPDFVDRAKALGPIDLVVGGSPCQSFSVAGLGKSLDDARGNLTLRFVEVVSGIDPDFVVWENVPGIFPKRDNPFGCFLAGLVGADAPIVPPRGGRWTSAGLVAGPRRTAAWRVLDAQWFGVAQRRSRVFVVSGRAGDFRCAEILLERPCVRRDPPTRGAKGEGAAADVAVCLRGRSNDSHREDQSTHVACYGGGNRGPVDVATSQSAKGGTGRIDFESETFVAVDLQNMALRTDGLSGTICGEAQATGNRAESVLSCPALGGGGGKPGSGYPAVAFHATQDPISGDVAPRIGQGNSHGTGSIAVAFQESQTGVREYAEAGSLRASGPGHDPVGTRVRDGMAVRRLTPRECERLQGMPDDWTLVTIRRKPAADGPRYKAIGNSMAVPVMRWIGERLEAAR